MQHCPGKWHWAPDAISRNPVTTVQSLLDTFPIEPILLRKSWWLRIVMGPLPTHSWTLPNSILIERQVLSKILDTLPIFDWQVSLAYATIFLLLLQYIFKLISCSELSFCGPNQGPHQLANEDSRLRTHAKQSQLIHISTGDEDWRLCSHGKKKLYPCWFIHQLVSKIRDDILTQIAQWIHINGLTKIRRKLIQNFSGFIHQLSN